MLNLLSGSLPAHRRHYAARDERLQSPFHRVETAIPFNIAILEQIVAIRDELNPVSKLTETAAAATCDSNAIMEKPKFLAHTGYRKTSILSGNGTRLGHRMILLF